MDNKQILEKAIQKAIDGGWDENTVDWVFQGEPTFEAYNYPFEYIFNHDFAKSLWGDGEVFIATEDVKKDELGTFVLSPLVEWQHRLQQMVIAEDPIKYLGDYI